MVALGKWLSPTHFSPKVPQVRAVLSAEQVQSPAGHVPSLDSLEHAMYGLEVAYEMPVPSCDSLWIHWYGPSSEPPWHEPALPQLRICRFGAGDACGLNGAHVNGKKVGLEGFRRTCCTESWMSMPLPPRAILMRSPSAETEPWAQHEPQYCGMCWLSEGVR